MIRGIFTWVMIFGFALMIYAGPLALMLVVSEWGPLYCFMYSNYIFL